MPEVMLRHILNMVQFVYKMIVSCSFLFFLKQIDMRRLKCGYFRSRCVILDVHRTMGKTHVAFKRFHKNFWESKRLEQKDVTTVHLMRKYARFVKTHPSSSDTSK